MAQPNSAKELAPVQAKTQPDAHTARLAPTELTFATITPGDEKIPEPTVDRGTKARQGLSNLFRPVVLPCSPMINAIP